MSRRILFAVRAGLVAVLVLVTAVLIVAVLQSPCPCCR
jgi:hypothetical protein